MSAEEFAKRRKTLLKHLNPNSIVIIPSANEMIRNGDAHYLFRQNSDFFYLTGFEEPEAIAVLIPNREDGEYILFNRTRDPSREIWDGPRAGQEGAVKDFHAHQSFPISQFKSMLPQLLEGREAIYYPVGSHPRFDKLILRAVNQVRAKIRGGITFPSQFLDISSALHEMRLLKSAHEIKIMQRAVDITAESHIAAMQMCKPGLYEYELEAKISYIFQKNAARSPAYSSIVGAGKNSCILHYVTNNAKIGANDIVLVDAGCEYQNYASDITRTFPANGKFSGEQKAIYELVLAAQLAAINTVKPGASFLAAQSVIVKILTQGLCDLGLLKGNVDNLIENQAYFPFYMHRSGHWLGLDVHDVGAYNLNNQWRPLQPGMVLTIEPGLYISENIPGVDKRWHNIGVRIEDDILVTETGHKVLSANIPKKIVDIESVMAH
jgi:Xaa-Pro aminopeptidase